MSDTVERLQALVASRAGDGPSGPAYDPELLTVLSEVVEELTRLRKENMNLRMTKHEGWKEASIAWSVCTSIHEKWGKGRDPLYSTRHADFERHANAAHRKLAWFAVNCTH